MQLQSHIMMSLAITAMLRYVLLHSSAVDNVNMDDDVWWYNSTHVLWHNLRQEFALHHHHGGAFKVP